MSPDPKTVLERLRRDRPRVERPDLHGVFEIVLHENVAYLVPDARRAAVWAEFRSRIGISPLAVLDAPSELLCEILQPGGMLPEHRLAKVRACAEIAMEEFDGDVDAILELPEKKRRAALKRFPGFADPGADRVLMLTGAEHVLSLDSNALRVLLRLGIGTESRNYSASYRSAQAAIADGLPARRDQLVAAYWRLRAHGQTVCRNTRPLCPDCCLRDLCRSASP